jgi:hypothetical protein
MVVPDCECKATCIKAAITNETVYIFNFFTFFYKRVCGSSLVCRVGVAYNPVPQYRFASGRVGSMGYSPMGHFFAYEFLTASRKTHFTTKEGFRGSDPACVCFFLFLWS